MPFLRRYQGTIQKKGGYNCGKVARQSKSVRDHQLASSHGAEDRRFKKEGVLAPQHTCHLSAGIKNLWSNKKTLDLKLRMAASWAAHLWMVPKTGKKQV